MASTPIFFTITGRPPTLNTTYAPAINRRTGKPYMRKSTRAKQYAKSALEQIMQQKLEQSIRCFKATDELEATIYVQQADRRGGDTDASLKELFDLLQNPKQKARGGWTDGAGIMADDKQIKSHKVVLCPPTKGGCIIVKLEVIQERERAWQEVEHLLGEFL